MNDEARRLRVALVGVGRMGRNHLRLLRESPQFELVAVVDPLAAEPDGTELRGARFFRNLADLASEQLDCAVIAAPTDRHFELASTLVGRGLHLLIEKPLASSTAECLQLTRILQGTELRVAVGHVERFNPALLKLAEVIERGWLGQPIHASFTRVGGYPETNVGKNNVLLDLAVHDIDLFRSMFGPAHFEWSVTHSTVEPSVVDTAEILLSARSGVTAAIHVNWITPTKIRNLRITGSRGVCMVDYILQSCELYGGSLLSSPSPEDSGFESIRELYRSTDRIIFGVVKEEPLKTQLRQFYHYVTAGSLGRLCSTTDALAAVQIAEGAMKRGAGRALESRNWY